MAFFYHVDFRGEIREGDVLSTMPVTPSQFPDDADELNRMFPDGLSFFGATMLHMEFESIDETIEQILESVRRKFSDKCRVKFPSRMSSLFACDNFEAAKIFRDNHNRGTARIWRVEAADFFRGDMNYIGKEMTEDHDLAVHYWQGRARTESPVWEFLLRPPIKVICLVDES